MGRDIFKKVAAREERISLKKPLMERAKERPFARKCLNFLKTFSIFGRFRKNTLSCLGIFS